MSDELFYFDVLDINPENGFMNHHLHYWAHDAAEALAMYMELVAINMLPTGTITVTQVDPPEGI